MVTGTDLKNWIRQAAERLGFDLCGVAPAVLPEEDRGQYLWWIDQGYHGEMGYMEREQRRDIRLLFPEVRSIICAAMVYNTAYPRSVDCQDPSRGWISRYGWGDDYHSIMRDRLEQLLAEMSSAVGSPFEAKIYVDTGPLLERTIARAAGLGWVGKNTCLINQKVGSWFVVGEILTSLELPPDQPVPDRCGTCRRCIDACPTAAIVAPGVLDATRCIAYFTIEARGSIPEEFRPGIGRHVFGCDICQDVCPWNRKAPASLLPGFQPRNFHASAPLEPSRDRKGEDISFNQSRDREGADIPSRDRLSRSASVPAGPERRQDGRTNTAFNPPLEWLASLSDSDFSTLFRGSPVKRARYRGMLRNVAIAMGNSGEPRYRPILEKLVQFPDEVVQEHAHWALARLSEPRA